MASLTVATSLFLKNQKKETFRSPFKPWLQVVFLIFNGWILIFTMADKPIESLIGCGILLAGVIIYYLDKPVVSIER
ncbi:MAG: hypothetical protein WKI04_13590 [Ferruginibacter sp.]